MTAVELLNTTTMKLEFLLSTFLISLVIASNDGKHALNSRRSSSTLGIVNGKKTTIKKYPFMAAFFQNSNLAGAGVILSNRWILTTASNVNGYSLSDLEFRVGSTNYAKGGQLLHAQEIKVPSSYDGSWDYDIAVVKVTKTIAFSSTVKAVGVGTNMLMAGKQVNIVGWSSPGGSKPLTLLTSTVTVYNKTECESQYPSDDLTRTMCTFNSNTGPETASAYDYGDPLIYNSTVYGLYAGGNSDLTVPALYTCVPMLHQWVLAAIQD